MDLNHLTIYKFEILEKKLDLVFLGALEIFSVLRKEFPDSLFLENFYGEEKNKKVSLIALNPIFGILVEENKAKITYPDKTYKEFSLKFGSKQLQELINSLLNSLKPKTKNSKFSGFYGYFSYEALQYVEKIKLNSPDNTATEIPEACLHFYQNLIIFDNKEKSLTLLEHQFENSKASQLEKIEYLIQSKKSSFEPFYSISKPISNLSKDNYKKNVQKAKKHCLVGDVFQMVISLCFSQKFKGDSLSVFRALRKINPTSYLFYLDYKNYQIFGASPEIQLVVENNKAYLEPIAGTIPKSNETQEKESIKNFLENKKENSEHVMLVDLARNDLSKYCKNVKLNFYKQIKAYPHLFHMVSQISGDLEKNVSAMEVFSGSFPAGTLSGAPKYKALELIDKIENKKRGIYAGSVGFFGLNNNLYSAIMIRSFLAKSNHLFLQAGGGITHLSNEEKEYEEIQTKLKSLYKAIEKSSKN